jgi:subfamily B ATP-binding cassette protein MsbA
MVGTVTQVLAQLSIPLLLAAIVDDALVARDPRALTRLTAGLALVAVLLHAGRITQEVLFRRATQRSLDHLQLQLAGHLVSLPLTWFDREESGRLQSHFTEDCPQVTRLVEPVLRLAFHNATLLAGLLIVLLAKYGRLAALALLLIPLYLVLPTLLSRRVREATGDLLAQRTRANARFHEMLQVVREIKIFGRERWSRERAREALDGRLRSYGRFTLFNSFQSIGAALYFFIAALVYRFGGERVLEGSLGIGDLVALVSLLGMLETPVGQLAGLNAVVQGCRAAMDRLRPVLTEAAERAGGEELEIAPGEARVRFEDVTFRYPGKSEPALDGVSFTLEPGRRVAVVGPSGAGKSTLAHLLLGLYEPDGGRILLAGRDLGRVSLTSLRAQVGIVRQDAVLLAGTVRENIAFGRPSAGREEIEQAARIAGAEEFIAELPRGFDTEIGERGVALSGGQRQRIAIARTVLRQPPVLILDEATSALDGRTERAVREALERASRGRTVLVIAHRLSTVADADTILVLDRGRLVAQGRHPTLLDSCDVYRHLHQATAVTPQDTPATVNEATP